MREPLQDELVRQSMWRLGEKEVGKIKEGSSSDFKQIHSKLRLLIKFD